MPRPRWSAWGCLALACFCARASAEGPEAAHLAAPDALFSFEITRPAAVVDRIEGPRVQALLDGVPGYREATQGEDYRKFRAGVDLVSTRLGMPWQRALRELTGGGLLLAVGGEKADRTLIVATPSDPATLAKAHAILLDLARQDAATKGQPDPIRQVEHRQVAVFLGGGKQGVHAIVDGKLLVASSREVLEAAIDRGLDKGASLADEPLWAARRKAVEPAATAWAFARLDRLRAMDPGKYGGNGQAFPPPFQLFLGPWVEALSKAPWASVALTWDEARLAADLTLPTPPGGYSPAQKAILTPRTAGAPGLLLPPRAIASLSLWRDLSAVWEVRNELFPPQVVQDLAKLDGVAGTFFGGRDFGTGVLGALGSDWRLVVAAQDAKDLDPVPDAKLPAFALVVGLKPDDEEFAQRLRVAFQSFIGLSNLGAAQQKAPPLELGSMTVEGITIATARYLPPKPGKAPAGPVNTRHNFSPSSAVVGDTFVLSSSAGLARDLVRILGAKARPGAGDASLTLRVEGADLAAILDANRARLVAKTMLDKGSDRAKAEAEFGTLLTLLRTLNHASLGVVDGDDSVRVRLHFDLGQP